MLAIGKSKILSSVNELRAQSYYQIFAGQLEKSLSTHSDSSGFADIDQAMETSPITELSGGMTPGFEMAKVGDYCLQVFFFLAVLSVLTLLM